MNTPSPLVGVIMGSRSDWDVMKHAADMLALLGVPHECRVVSAHRTPDLLFEYASTAAERGLEVVIAGAGGAAHLPGMCAAKTHLPVLGVPVAHEASFLRGQDALLSIVQMPAGIPVGTLAIGKAGATNAALLAAAILANKHPAIKEKLIAFRAKQTQKVLEKPDPSVAGALIAIAGLPGSGKSHRVRELRTTCSGVSAEDFHADSWCHSKRVDHSRHFEAMIRDLRDGKDCAIADIAFCDSERRIAVNEAVLGAVPDATVVWEYFENDAEQCKHNVRQRNRGNVSEQLNRIDEFSSGYRIPSDAQVVHPVWPKSRSAQGEEAK